MIQSPSSLFPRRQCLTHHQVCSTPGTKPKGATRSLNENSSKIGLTQDGGAGGGRGMTMFPAIAYNAVFVNGMKFVLTHLLFAFLNEVPRFKMILFLSCFYFCNHIYVYIYIYIYTHKLDFCLARSCKLQQLIMCEILKEIFLLCHIRPSLFPTSICSWYTSTKKPLTKQHNAYHKYICFIHIQQLYVYIYA